MCFKDRERERGVLNTWGSLSFLPEELLLACNLTLSTSGFGFCAFFFFGTPPSYTAGWNSSSTDEDLATLTPLKKKLETFFFRLFQQLSISLTYFCKKKKQEKKRTSFFLFLFLCVYIFFLPFEFIKRSTCPELKFDSFSSVCHPISFSHGTRRVFSFLSLSLEKCPWLFWPAISVGIYLLFKSNSFQSIHPK